MRVLMGIVGLLAAVGVVAAVEPTAFYFEFSGGLNLRDQPTALGITGQVPKYVVGNSYNFDFYPDGTARKRPGISADTVGLSGDGAGVNFMEWMPLDPTDGGYGPVLVHTGTKWFKRATDATVASVAYSQVPAVTALATVDSGCIGSAFYGRYLYVASRYIPMARFDGDSLSRVAIEDVINIPRASVYVAAGGALDVEQTYYYAHTYVTEYEKFDGQLQEGPLSAPDSITTPDSTYRTIVYTNIPSWPASLGAEPDTNQIEKINIYRSTDGANFYYLNTIATTDTGYTDDGSLGVGFITQRDQQSYPDTLIDLEEHNDFLFMVGGSRDSLWSANVQLHSKSTVAGGYRYCITIWGDADGDMDVDSADSQKILDYLIDPNTPIRFRNADVSGNGSVTAWDSALILLYINDKAGSYFDASITGLLSVGIPTNSSISDGINGRTITSVLSDTTFEISGDSLAQYTTNTYTIKTPYLQRLGIFNTFSDGNVPIVSNWDAPNQTAATQANPLRISSGGSSLHVYGQRGVGALVGYDEPFISTVIAPRAGIVGAGALAHYESGDIYLDYNGLYYLQESYTSQRLSDILLNSIVDSAAAGRLDQSLVFEHDNDIYVSTIDTGDKTDIWKFSTRFGNWTRYKGWHVGSFAEWDATGGSKVDLYWGDRRTDNIYKVSPSRTADESIASVDSAIVGELHSPAFNFGVDDGQWDELALTIDTNDSVRVTFDIAGYDSVFTTTAFVLSPSAGNTSFAAGYPRTEIIPIGATGHSCRVNIWTSGTGRCIIYPSRVVATRVGIR